MDWRKREKLKVGDAIWLIDDVVTNECFPGVVTGFGVDDDEDTLVFYLSSDGSVGHTFIPDVLPMGYEFPELANLIKQMDREITAWIMEKSGAEVHEK